MQQTHERISKLNVQKLKSAVCGLVWAGGLILAGSDGPMMPYVNILGVGVFAGANLWLARQSRKGSEAKDRSKVYGDLRTEPVCRPATVARIIPVQSRSESRVTGHSRYARGLGAV